MMGATPIPRVPPLRYFGASRVDRLKREYALGRIDLDEFEWGVTVLLMYGRGDESWSPLSPPPKPGDLYSLNEERWVTPLEEGIELESERR